MLTSLHIKNYALIEDVTVSFTSGFTSITGETGAGKSIILGALGLVLGERADSTHIRNNEKKCVVEAHFELAGYSLQGVFEELDFDYEKHTILRREILPSGKSRAFVNDSPVRLQDLQSLSTHLIDIHSQHETLVIGSTGFQYNVLDSFAQLNDELTNYQKEYATYKQLKKELTELQQKQSEADEAYDLNLFLLNELEEASLVAGIQEKLEQQQEQLSNVELLKETLSFTNQTLQQEELGVLDLLQQVQLQLQKISGVNPTYEQLYQRILEAKVELDDLSFEVEKAFDGIEDDPALLVEVNAQLQLIYKLQKKHQVQSVEELSAIQERLADAVFEKQSSKERLDDLQKSVQQQEKKCKDLANQLFEKRKNSTEQFTAEVASILSNIGMKDAVLQIQLAKVDVLNERGIDQMSWLFSANKGGSLQLIHKVASGGELSRIVLAVKSILAKYAKLPTIVFDEIDTGVSGDVANKMGNILKEMGVYMQVLSITHLPQVAAKASSHYKVYKETTNETTVSLLKELSLEERIKEMTAMLGGDVSSEAAVAHAKSLFN